VPALTATLIWFEAKCKAESSSLGGVCSSGGHYEVSQACGERVLFPAVRGSAADDLVVAPGFSCRHQIADFCDNRGSLHTAELLAMARG
jgi:hypothetical protein